MFYSKQVYRVFNNSTFSNGGRFYGAWWIGVPKQYRMHIHIDGKPTVELDYSNLHFETTSQADVRRPDRIIVLLTDTVICSRTQQQAEP